jgi:hypothetical protein
MTMTTETLFAVAERAEVLRRYFEAINGGQYGEAAALFEEDGVLVAPLGVHVHGRGAIAAYLAKKCDGMHLLPEACVPGDGAVAVTGRARTVAFVVNVEWHFVLNGGGRIRSLRVRLLASLKDLAHLRDSPHT